jgi:large subunit ribosomal protein L13
LKTLNPKPETVESKWYLVNAEDQVLGRMCARIASILRGKHHPEFSPHWDFGDHVIVINADKIKLTGNKAASKEYFRHTGYPGGGKTVPFNRMLANYPERIITHAVWGMLPKNRLGRKLASKLKVYRGAEHPHEAQKPVPLEDVA